MSITQLDHLVLTVRDMDASIAFYTDVLGMQAISFAGNRKALKFGPQKINLHQQGEEISPHAQQATPGSADLCLLTDVPLAEVMQHLQQHDVPIELGPVERTGANGPILSVYIRDPDNNLLEIANLL
jgi:catechol 2,3-dioxygenase-like lactoylglutathione lyase family enzyme